MSKRFLRILILANKLHLHCIQMSEISQIEHTILEDIIHRNLDPPKIFGMNI